MTELSNDFYVSVARNLCTLTDGQWEHKVDQYGNHTIVEAGSKLSLWFRAGGYGNEGKIKIGYDRPRDAKGEYVYVYHPMGGAKLDNPSINVSASKDALTVAKDIERRVLGACHHVHALVVKQIAQNAEHEAKKLGLVTDLAAICNAKVSNPNSSQPTINPYESINPRADYRCGYGTITVSGDSAEIKLQSLPPVLAKELTAVIVETLKKASNRTA